MPRHLCANSLKRGSTNANWELTTIRNKAREGLAQQNSTQTYNEQRSPPSYYSTLKIQLATQRTSPLSLSLTHLPTRSSTPKTSQGKRITTTSKLTDPGPHESARLPRKLSLEAGIQGATQPPQRLEGKEIFNPQRTNNLPEQLNSYWLASALAGTNNSCLLTTQSRNPLAGLTAALL